jgi:lipoprotein-anchoring transpeptidase ErfK/SrfK
MKKMLLIPAVMLLSAGIYFGIAYGLPTRKVQVEAAVNKDITPYKNPGVLKLYPSDGQKEIVLDIENPVVVDFNKSTKNSFIKFVLDPSVEVVYENNPEKTQFKLMPKTPLIDGQQYKLEIYAKQLNTSDDSYEKISSSSFTVLPKAPATWEKDYALRIEQAKKYARPKIATGKYIDINIGQQIMSIFENGKLMDSFLVSSGKRGMDTPKGEFKIYNKSPKPWSKAYSLYMPYWMAIMPDGSLGIHELPEWPGGYKEGANHLGTPVSHGCVRLGVGPAKKVFDWTEVGTPVIIY